MGQVGPKLVPSRHQVGPMLAHADPSWSKLAQIGPMLAPRWRQVGPCWLMLARSWPLPRACEPSIRIRGVMQSRITYQEWPSRITYQARRSSCLRPLGCSNLVLLSSCLAMSFLSKRFIQTFPPGVPVDVSFLLLHLFRALHEGTLVSTW